MMRRALGFVPENSQFQIPAVLLSCECGTAGNFGEFPEYPPWYSCCSYFADNRSASADSRYGFADQIPEFCKVQNDTVSVPEIHYVKWKDSVADNSLCKKGFPIRFWAVPCPE